MKFTEFICLAFGLALCGCVDTGTWVFHKDGSYGPRWWHADSSSVWLEVQR